MHRDYLLQVQFGSRMAFLQPLMTLDSELEAKDRRAFISCCIKLFVRKGA